jgi:hypothetical protein
MDVPEVGIVVHNVVVSVFKGISNDVSVGNSASFLEWVVESIRFL